MRVLSLFLAACLCSARAAAQSLDSWNDGPAKQAILAFVAAATTPGDKGFVRPEERVAAFDFDGTLAVEQPVYGQLLFCAQQIDRRMAAPGAPPPDALARKIHALLPHPERLNDLTYEENEAAWAHGLSGASGAEVQARVRRWFASDRHPKLKKSREALLYQPMLELIRFLSAKGFRVFIVTGSTADYVRAVSEELLGVPRENVIASEVARRWVEPRGEIERTPRWSDMVDRDAKVLEIDRRLGRRPILAIGNSDGDVPMLAYATSGAGPSFAALVHHDDAEREYAYDWGSPIGPLEKGLELAPKRAWKLISMKEDWKRVWP